MGKNEQFTTEDCIKWKADKNINPITGYKIRKGKGVYKILEKTCFAIKTPPPQEEPKKLSAIVRKIGAKTYTFDKDICLKWYANKYTNPFSGYKINEASIIYKTFDDVCKTLNIQQEQPKEKTKNT